MIFYNNLFSCLNKLIQIDFDKLDMRTFSGFKKVPTYGKTVRPPSLTWGWKWEDILKMWSNVKRKLRNQKSIEWTSERNPITVAILSPSWTKFGSWEETKSLSKLTSLSQNDHHHLMHRWLRREILEEGVKMRSEVSAEPIVGNLDALGCEDPRFLSSGPLRFGFKSWKHLSWNISAESAAAGLK